MKRNPLLLLSLALAASSCTKDALYEPAELTNLPVTRAVTENPISEFVNKPLYIQTYRGEEPGNITCYLSLLYDNSDDTEAKGKCRFLPALTVEPFDATSLPDLKKRQRWYIRSTNGKYYLESAISDLVTQENVCGMYGDTDFWDYWIPCYGNFPLGHYGDSNALYVDLKSNTALAGERFLTFEDVGDGTKSLWKIKANSAAYPGYYMYYPNPNNNGGQIKMYNTNQGFNTFEILYAEHMEFLKIEYDITEAQYVLEPREMEIIERNNPNPNESIPDQFTWIKSTRKHYNWSKDTTKTYKFSTDITAGLELGMCKTKATLGLKYTSSYDESYKGHYGEEYDETVTTQETITYTLAPGQRIRIIREISDCKATIPYTLYFRGKTTGQTYALNGYWSGVNITRNSLLAYDVTSGTESSVFLSSTEMDGIKDNYYDDKVNLSLEDEGNGYYRLYYSFVNPEYVNPEYEMYITRIVNGINDFVLYHPEGHYKDTQTGRPFYRFRYPAGGTSYRLDVVVTSADKTTYGSIYVDEAH